MSFETNVDLLASYLEPRGLGKVDATGARLGHVSDILPGYERFLGWMSIPYVAANGNVVAIKFRCLKHEDCKAEHCQRYDSPAGQKPRLYNAGALARGGEMAAVVEGELKALVTQKVLGIPTVGTSAGVWLDHWPRCLADFPRVLVIADNDEAGLKHAKTRVLKSLSNAELVTPPSDHPKIDDWANEVGAEVVRKAILG